jgi:hypothetical protein
MPPPPPGTPAALGELRRAKLDSAIAIGIVIGASGLLFVWPETLPGLHADEAWSLFRAKEILEGYRPAGGMNYYTGALHQYLLAVFAQAFGLHVWAARALSALLNLAALASFMQIVRGLHPGKRTWLWAGAVCMTSAPFVLCSRFATEITSLTPLLICLGLLCMQQAWYATRRRSARAALGGVFLGLAVYNHMAAAAAVAALCVGYLIALGAKSFRDPRSYAAAAGLCLGVSPRIFQILELPTNRAGPLQRLLHNFSADALSDVLHTPAVLRGMLDGDLLYQRFAGRNLLWVPPFFSAALVLLAGARLASGARQMARRDVGLLAALASSLAFTALIAPGLALRYLIVPALATCYLLARLALGALSTPGGPEPAVKARSSLRALGPTTLVLVISLQSLYLGVNYFYSHRVSGGQVSVFPLGARLMEMSNGFIRSDGLYAQLLERNISSIVANNAIRWPLQYYDLQAGRLQSAVPEKRGWRAPAHEASALIFYNGPTPAGGMTISDMRGEQTLAFKGAQFRLAAGFDPHFLVFVHQPGD